MVKNNCLFRINNTLSALVFWAIPRPIHYPDGTNFSISDRQNHIAIRSRYDSNRIDDSIQFNYMFRHRIFSDFIQTTRHFDKNRAYFMS